MAARSIASLSLTFGLVSIPVKLYLATESAGTVSFNLLTQDGSRVKQQYVSTKDGQVVERNQMVKGYEFEKDRFVLFSADEPGALYALKWGPPIVLGLGKGENFVASDATALLPHTRDLIFLEDGDLARVTADGVTVTGEADAGAVAVTVTVLVGAAAGVEEPHAAVSKASEVRQDPASASRLMIADTLMDSLSGKRRSL